MDCADVDVVVQPERKLLNFLSLIANLLQETDFDLDNVCHRLENIHINHIDSSGSEMNQDSAVLSSKELKSVLFSDNNLIASLEMSITALLDLLLYQIQNEDQMYYKKIALNIARPICTSLQVFEKHINSTSIKTSLRKFLVDLIKMLGNCETPVDENGPICLFITRILRLFKDISFARKAILCEIGRKLKTFRTFMMKSSKEDLYATPCFENLMLHLSVTKEMLQCDLQTSKIILSKPEKKNNTLVEIGDILAIIMNSLPGHIQTLAQECLNLVS